MIFALKYYIKKIFWSDQRNIDTFLRLCIFSDITADRYVDWPDPSVNILTIQSRFFPRQVLNHHLQFLKTSIFYFLCDYIWKSTQACSQVRHQVCYQVQTWSLVTCRLLSPRHGREQLTCRLVLIARPVLGLPACTLHSRPWASEDKAAVLCRMTLGPQMLPLNDNSILRKLYWVVDKAPENVPSRVCRCGLTSHSHNSLRHLDPRRSCASAPRSSLLHSQRCSKCSYSPPASAPSCQQHKRTPAVLRTPDYAASGRAAELIPDLSYICRNLNFTSYTIHKST